MTAGQAGGKEVTRNHIIEGCTHNKDPVLGGSDVQG